MQPARILIVDDESSIRFVIERTLSRDGYLTDTAAGGEEAIGKLAENEYDLMLLDLRMEPVDGMQVLHAARQKGADLVVIILTGYGTLESAVEALRLGAFDYLFKPALPETIRQRVKDGLEHRQKQLQRRSLVTQLETLRETLTSLETASAPGEPPSAEHRFLYAGKLVIDRYHRTATLENHPLDLTTTEFDLLLCLASAAPEPVSSRQLVKAVMGYDAEERVASETIKWHIHHLRRKVEPDIDRPQYIKNVRYKGYLWSGE